MLCFGRCAGGVDMRCSEECPHCEYNFRTEMYECRQYGINEIYLGEVCVEYQETEDVPGDDGVIQREGSGA